MLQMARCLNHIHMYKYVSVKQDSAMLVAASASYQLGGVLSFCSLQGTVVLYTTESIPG